MAVQIRRFFPQFFNDENEKLFLDTILSGTKYMGRLSIYGYNIVSLALISSDILALDHNKNVLSYVILCRLMFLLISILTVLKLKSCKQYKSYLKLILTWAFSTILLNITIETLLDQYFVINIALQVGILMTFYFAFLNQMKYQLFLALSFSFLTIGAMLFFSDLKNERFLQVLIIHSCMNSFGFTISNYMQFTKRRFFAKYQEQKALKLELEEALANVKTLSGLIPICSSCGKIRDDDGYWNRVEEYIQKRTSAQFTHGICKPCATKIYEEELGKNYS